MPPVESRKKNLQTKKTFRLKKRKEEEENLRWSGPLRSPEAHVCWPVDNPVDNQTFPCLIIKPFANQTRFDSDNQINISITPDRFWIRV
jgi:hypothetical protein